MNFTPPASNSSLHFHFKENQTSVFTVIHFQVPPVFSIAFVLIFLASLVGNSIIIHIIRKDNNMKTKTNYLIMTQGCADLFVTITQLINVLIPFKNFTTHLWIGGLVGQITCKFLLASVVISPVFSAWILVIIAIERFYAVTRPLKPSPISRHLQKAILMISSWSVASSVSVIVNGIVIKIKARDYCGLPSDWTGIEVGLAALNMFLPFAMIAALYTIVCLKLWSREVPGEGANHNQRQAEALKTAKKVTCMMIFVVVLYIVCWFPSFIVLVLYVLNYVKVSFNIHLFFIWLTVAFSEINPYIYLIFNQSFRQASVTLFVHFFRKIKVHNVPRLCSQNLELKQT